MKHGAALATALYALAAGEVVRAETWVASGDLAAALLVSQPQRSLFGPGGAGSLAVHRSLMPKLLVGLRLRAGVFSNTDQSDVTRADPRSGGVGAALASLRVRPLGQATDLDRARGLWLELGLGGGVTGSLARPMGEVGAGWGFGLGHIVLGPALRYHHIVQPGTGSDGSDAKIVLLGIEAAWSGRIQLPSPPAPSLPAEPPPPPPPKDSDGDGLLDPDDRCPGEPEDKDGFEDEDGCPDNDNDRDGIADADDGCPLEAEVINGVDDTDGCPDEGIITMVDDRVVLEEEVLFKTDRARVSTRGRQALAAVVRLWQQHPEWERLDVEGHADERGPDGYNQWLSEERATRVRKALIELGLDAAKVTTKGFGKTRPRREGRDEESLRLNRRVELVVVRKRPQTEAAPAAAPAAPAGELAPAPVPPAAKEAP